MDKKWKEIYTKAGYNDEKFIVYLESDAIENENIKKHVHILLKKSSFAFLFNNEEEHIKVKELKFNNKGRSWGKALEIQGLGVISKEVAMRTSMSSSILQTQET